MQENQPSIFKDFTSEWLNLKVSTLRDRSLSFREKLPSKSSGWFRFYCDRFCLKLIAWGQSSFFLPQEICLNISINKQSVGNVLPSSGGEVKRSGL